MAETRNALSCYVKSRARFSLAWRSIDPGYDLTGIALHLFNQRTNANLTALTTFHRPLERSTATRPYKGAIYDLERDPSLPLFTEAVDLHLDRPHGSFHVSGAQGPYQILVFSHKSCSVLRGTALLSHKSNFTVQCHAKRSNLCS